MAVDCRVALRASRDDQACEPGAAVSLSKDGGLGTRSLGRPRRGRAALQAADRRGDAQSGAFCNDNIRKDSCYVTFSDCMTWKGHLYLIVTSEALWAGKMLVRVTFDSNAWEPIFDPTVSEWTPIRAALANGVFNGFICEAGFRIEAVTRKNRATYFAQPHFGSRIEGIVERDGRPYLHMSFGPEDDHHPGLPPIQAARLQEALKCGIRLIRASSWMGLPAPRELLDPTIFVPETSESADQRIQRQSDFLQVSKRAVLARRRLTRLEGGTFRRQRQSITNDLTKHVPNGRTEKRSQPMSAMATRGLY